MKSDKKMKRERATQVELEKFREVKAKSQILADFFKELGHKGRLAVLYRLCKESRTVTDLTKDVGLKQTTVSQILTRLVAAELVVCDEEGRQHFYKPYNEDIKDAMNEILEVLLKADESQKRKEEEERKAKLLR